ncbi:hypothetical protein ACGFX4_35590 [Kitasatospora sp. NPDC048365]|uniref:hypothetical protein n=1 Tax=Kitasatospora sp. NPDC048365 TaxID=3364050 RepID=UPI0037109CB0
MSREITLRQKGPVMASPKLTVQEMELVRTWIETAPGCALDRDDLWRARLAETERARIRKLGPNMYEIIGPALATAKAEREVRESAVAPDSAGW